MLKTKQRRLAIVAILVISLMAMYGGMPVVNADSMNSVKVTLGDSEPSVAVATSTIVFDLGTAITAGQYVLITYADEFGFDTATATCPALTTFTATTTNPNTVTCTVDATQTLLANTLHTITVHDVVNPAIGPYAVTVSTHQAGGTEIENSDTKVYIINDVMVTAHVAASLSFTVSGVSTSTAINGTDQTTDTTSATEIAFKTLEPEVVSMMAQQLSVSTNADDGYTVTVQQDKNMENAAGADIDSFVTGGPADWVQPSGLLADETTWGYMGVATDDSSYAAFADGYYQGLDGTTPLPIMTHNGPADGLTVGAGLANVAYNIEITGLQEAGDYDNTLTYVCTPTY